MTYGKTKLKNNENRGSRKTQVKGTENLFNNIIETNFSYENKNCFLREHISQIVKVSKTKDGGSNIFHDTTKFKQYLSTNPALLNSLEEKLQPETDQPNKTKTR